MSAVKSWKRSPVHPDVANFVDCYWYLESPSGPHRQSYPKLNPDPCGHLILSHSSQPYEYQFDEVHSKGVGSHWIFPHRQTIRMNHSQPFRIFGIKFHPGSLYSLHMEPCQPVLDQVADAKLNDMFLSEAVNEDVLEKAACQQKLCCEFMDRALLPWFGKSKTDNTVILSGELSLCCHKRLFPIWARFCTARNARWKGVFFG